MRLLAVDQGSSECGLAFFTDRALIDLRVARGRGPDRSRRMESIGQQIRELAAVSDWYPDVIAIEDVVMHRGHPNPRSVMAMAETRGFLASLFGGIYPGVRQLAIHPARVRSVIGAPRDRIGAKARNRWALETMSGWKGPATQDEADAYVIGLAALEQLRAEDLERMAKGSGERKVAMR